jgi:argininosuccinate lyase
MSILRGLFEGDEDDLFRAFASSLEMDLWIAEEDIEGSIAHVTMLGGVGVLSSDEAKTLTDGLTQILEEFRNGTWAPDETQEDIHMAVEAHLTDLVGDVGGKLHTARSRNDQVATDVRLWLKRRFGNLEVALRDLVTALLDRVEADGQALLPGYTHLQRGQPILLGHHLLAHAWALSRDLERMQGVTARVDRCPLGAGALAGTPHPINRQQTAELLGFSGPIENAMDAVASKDHLQETVSACAICMSTLSRMAEELVLWSSAEFAFIRLDERHTTSSSIMPQKRNPDGAELLRGEAGMVFGHLQALLTLTKAMPLAYNRDLQNERKPLIESVLRTTASVQLLAAMWSRLDVRMARFERELYGASPPSSPTFWLSVVCHSGRPTASWLRPSSGVRSRAATSTSSMAAPRNSSILISRRIWDSGWIREQPPSGGTLSGARQPLKSSVNYRFCGRW